MARKFKEVISKCGADRRRTGYYATPLQVSRYISKRLLEINPSGERLIDPCVGKEELIQPYIKKISKITGIDIVDYNNEKKCEYYNADFLELFQDYQNSDLFEDKKIKFDDFDYWVANPPYNCHEVDYIKDNKHRLKIAFNDVGVHNMYSMFISAIVDMAKEGAVIGVITLDSFLTSKAHTKLREKIFNNCIIHDLLLCPTDLFLEQGADVRTCILIMEKRIPINAKSIRLLNRPISKNIFFNQLKQEKFQSLPFENIVLDHAIDNREVLIGVPSSIRSIFNNKRIGELFKCITGISTGNDKKYISKTKNKKFSIPFYKNPGSQKFFCKPDGFLINSYLQENKKVKNFMVRNIPLLNKEGITCSSMGVEFSACYLPQNSTYGVNPNIICDGKDIWWLLAFLNSNVAKYIIRGILSRTNMVTSGYVSRLPLPFFTEEEKCNLAKISTDAYAIAKKSPNEVINSLDKINDIIYQNLKLSAETIFFIDDFCKNIVRRT